jgi:hypothetical protein
VAGLGYWLLMRSLPQEDEAPAPVPAAQAPETVGA